MKESLLPRIETSLKNGDLIELVDRLISEGFSQLEIYDGYMQLYLQLREDHRGGEEDDVADILDTIVGWCSPHCRHFSHSLTNEEIEEYQKQKNSDKSVA